MFPKSPFYFVCRRTNLSWVKSNKSSYPDIEQLLQSKNHDLVTVDVQMSQEQENICSQTSVDEGIIFDVDIDDDINTDNDCVYYKNHPIFTDKMATFKRAEQLCGNDTEKHKELYELLQNFVTTNEMDNNDNNKVFAKKKADGDDSTTLISSNKVVNRTHKSNKRMKRSYER